MTRFRVPLVLLLLVLSLAVESALFSVPTEGEDWPQWRGPLGTGEAPGAEPPIRWSETENVRWKVEVPGTGHASPIVWRDQVFLATALAPPMPEGDFVVHPEGSVEFVVLALDRATGTVRWQRTAAKAVPHEGMHIHSTRASASPVTDGEVLVVSFGSFGIFGYDLAGEPLWSTDLGVMTTRNGFGEGASPALHGDTVVITWDHEGDSFLVALDKRTGQERWKQPREEPTSWATPLIVEVNGRPQVVVNGTHKVHGYDLATGEILWSIGGTTLNAIPTPVAADGVAYVMGGFRGNDLKAIELAQASEDPAAALRWQYARDTPYVPSPLLYDGKLFMLKHNKGILTVFEAATGKVLVGPQRLEEIDGAYASLVGAGGHVYVSSRDGRITVLEADGSFQPVVTNQLDDGFDASPAVVGNEMFLRGRKYLYCIAADPETAAATR